MRAAVAGSAGSAGYVTVREVELHGGRFRAPTTATTHVHQRAVKQAAKPIAAPAKVASAARPPSARRRARARRRRARAPGATADVGRRRHRRDGRVHPGEGTKHAPNGPAPGLSSCAAALRRRSRSERRRLRAARALRSRWGGSRQAGASPR